MGTLSLVDPLVLFKKSRLWSGTRFLLLPSFHHHLTQHNYTTQTLPLTVTLTSTSYSTPYRSRPTCNVVCPSGAWIKNRPHSTPSICLAQNPEAHNCAVGLALEHTHTYSLKKKIFKNTLLCTDICESTIYEHASSIIWSALIHCRLLHQLFYFVRANIL